MARLTDLRSARAGARGRGRRAAVAGWRCAAGCAAAPRRSAAAHPLLRLERIGDLLMPLPALAELRALAPDGDDRPGRRQLERDARRGDSRHRSRRDARRRLAGARAAAGRAARAAPLQAARLAARRYDLAINFEPDIRSNIAARGRRRAAAPWGSPAAAAARSSTWRSTTTRRAHTTDNARRLVARGARPRARRRRSPATLRDSRGQPRGGRAAARRRSRARCVGVHVSGGRAIKQWPRSAFRRSRRARWSRDRSAAIVLTGTRGRSRAGRRSSRAALPPDRVVDLSGDVDLLTVAAVHRRSSISSSPATPARCTWPPRSARRSSRCSGRRIRAATRRAARATRSSASTCRAARATGSGCRPRAASATRRTACAGIEVAPACWRPSTTTLAPRDAAR